MAGQALPNISRRNVVLGGASAAALIAVLGPGEAWALVRASGVRLGDHQDFTRFVVDLSHEVNFSLFTLPEPYRVVVDLPEVEWTFGEENVPEGRGVVGACGGGCSSRDSRVSCSI